MIPQVYTYHIVVKSMSQKLDILYHLLFGLQRTFDVLISCLNHYIIFVLLFAFVTQVLEKMQKADKTKDDVYEEFVMNFKKQEVLKI